MLREEIFAQPRVLERLSMPTITVLQLGPGLAWIPVAIMLFGVNPRATIFMVGVTALAPIVINTTAGVGGLFDPAAAWGIEQHTSGFGGTLAVYRVPSGPYLVMPIMGPSTARDAFGGLIDGVMRPDTWLLAATPRLIMAAGSGFTTYDIERERLDALRTTSVDFYAALRSAYLLDRDARIEMLIAAD